MGMSETDPVARAAGKVAEAIAELARGLAAEVLAAHHCQEQPRHPAAVLLTYGQACDRLGISESMLYKLLRTGTIRSVSLSKQTRRIPLAELDRYAATLLDAPAEDAS